MKIEKVSENQIRCILTKEDLDERKLKMNELAYGSEKAKDLFRDMMQQAAFQFGFDAENTPLMIEAIPLSSDSIALVVTKVENPEELDTRFSSFAPSVQNSTGEAAEAESSPLDQLMDVIKNAAAEAARSLSASPSRTEQAAPAASAVSPEQKKDSSSGEAEEYAAHVRDFLLTNRLYTFRTMRDILKAVSLCAHIYDGESALYYDKEHSVYYLFLQLKDPETAHAQQAVFAMLSEYGQLRPVSSARRQYLQENTLAICQENAVKTLSALI